MASRCSDRAGACLTVVLLGATAIAVWVTASERERDLLFEQGGGRVSVWDAMWMDLRPPDWESWDAGLPEIEPDRLAGFLDSTATPVGERSRCQVRADAEAEMIHRMNLAAAGFTAPPAR